MKLSALTAAVALMLAACGTSPTPSSSPDAALVQRQLDAQNAHNLDAFIATYSPNAELFDLPNASKPHTSGHAAMRKTYGEMFATLPKLQCKIDNRIVEEPYVIDHEICDFGMNEQPPMRAAVIYQVENGLIRRVWFAFKQFTFKE